MFGKIGAFGKNQNHHALEAPDHPDIEAAYKALNDAANQNYPDAQANVALIYQKGLLKSGRDLNQAGYMFRRAAENGDAKAQFWLGCYYQYGWGGFTKDRSNAIEQYSKAVANNYNLASSRANCASLSPVAARGFAKANSFTRASSFTLLKSAALILSLAFPLIAVRSSVDGRRHPQARTLWAPAGAERLSPIAACSFLLLCCSCADPSPLFPLG
jgi:Sel1 repeat